MGRHIAWTTALLGFTFGSLGSFVQRVEASPTSSEAAAVAKAPEEERGAYFWPLYVEGRLATQLRRLPKALQRVLSSSAGPTILLPERATADDVGLCAGAYVRF